MKRQCRECNGCGFIYDMDGDGYASEVVCQNCMGFGWIDDPDAERDIKEGLNETIAK